MPGASGLDLCRILRSTVEPVRLPIILMTGSDPNVDNAQGLEAGADEFVSKPFSARHLVAKIRSLLEIRDREFQRFQELKSSKGLNVELGRFVSSNIASRLSIEDPDKFLKPHRAEVTVLFVDLRRFTAFSEKVSPEEVLVVLQQYYTAVGTAAMKHKGTLSHLAGDGIMIFFNDPEPIIDHQGKAIQVALEARNSLLELKQLWDERHYDIDFGMGLAEGFATIGRIGFEGFSQYSVIGSVSNIASRLSSVADKGQILISHRFLSRLNHQTCQATLLKTVELKGIEKPVRLYAVISPAETLI
jgi:adenylate cyclase